MSIIKKAVSIALSLAILAGASTGLTASAKDNSSVIFDFNEDNITDEKDIESVSQFAKLHIPLNQAFVYGDLSAAEYDTTQADSIPHYFLTNVNQSTTPKYQRPLGDCWAFSAIGALESSALKAKNSSNKIDSKAFGEPVLSGLKDEIDLSERAVVWLAGEPVGNDNSQSGEGLVYADSGIGRYNNGGNGAFSETLFTSWRGVLDDQSAPHLPNNFDNSLKGLESNKDWSLPEGFSAKSADKAPRVTDYLCLPSFSEFVLDKEKGIRTWKSYDKKARSIVKQAILDYGAVSTDYDSKIDSRNSTFYTERKNTLPDHAVLIVGWDDNYSKDNFLNNAFSTSEAAPTEDGAWLVKNSWGSYDYMKSLYKNWDEDREGLNGMTYRETLEYAESHNITIEDMKKKKSNTENKYLYEFGIRDKDDRGTGYFWIYYNDRSICSNYVFKVDIADDGYDYDYNYQYDYTTSEDNLKTSLRTSDTNTLVSNVFTSNGNESLKAFSAYTNETDSVVKTDIYLLGGGESNPTEGKLVYSSDDRVKFAGFHTIKLTKEIKLAKGQKFAIVQNTRSHDNRTNAEVSYLNLETVLKPEYSSIRNAEHKVVCNENETYVFLDGSWTTPKQLNQNLDIAKVFTFGNAKIKAFTVNTVEEKSAPSQTVKKPVVKKANPMKISVSKKTVKAKKLRKKSQKAATLTVKNAAGKVSFKLKSVPKKIKKYVKLSAKGIVTVKKWKKAKKGDYKLKIKVTANGNSQYYPVTVDKTVKIKIK